MYANLISNPFLILCLCLTLQLAHIILLSSESPLASSLVPEVVQAESIDDIDDLLG